MVPPFGSWEGAGLEDLSPREHEILELAEGHPNKTIADRLRLTDGKLHVRSRTEAALKFRSAKVI